MTSKSGIIATWVGTALLLGGCVGTRPHPHRFPTVHLHGSVEGYSYTSAEGGFSVPFPVSGELDGRILSDSALSVTFTDNWGRRITFAGEPILEHSPMMEMVQAQGREKALTEFAKRQFRDLGDIHYHTNVCEGAVSFVYTRPVSHKAAVAMFIHGGRLFEAETILWPGVPVLGPGDEKSQLEQETWLENWAVSLAQTMVPK
jgi:hypothetical protein